MVAPVGPVRSSPPMRHGLGPLGILGVRSLTCWLVCQSAPEGTQRHVDQPHRPGQDHRCLGQSGSRTRASSLPAVDRRCGKQLFGVDAAGLMMVDAEGSQAGPAPPTRPLRPSRTAKSGWPQGPCPVASSQRLLASIGNIHAGPEWQRSSKSCSLKGSARRCVCRWSWTGGDWHPGHLRGRAAGLGFQRGGRPQANAGLVASLLTAAVTAPGDTPSRPRTGDRRLAASAAGDRRSCSELADLKPACTVRRHVLRRLPPR
jgi:hypothetical protein